MRKPPAIEGVDRFVGRGLPAIRIGDGSRILVNLPGLSLDERYPTGQARTMALAGWEPLLDRYTIYRVGRRQYPIGTTFRQMADDVITAIEGLRPPVDLMGASTGGSSRWRSRPCAPTWCVGSCSPSAGRR